MKIPEDKQLKPIVDLVGNIKKCQEAGVVMGAVALCYICIDTLAYRQP